MEDSHSRRWEFIFLIYEGIINIRKETLFIIVNPLPYMVPFSLSRQKKGAKFCIHRPS